MSRFFYVVFIWSFLKQQLVKLKMEFCIFQILKFVAYISLVIVVILFIVYKWSISTHDFFEKKGIDFIKPQPLFGNLKDILMKKTDFLTFSKSLYNHYTDKK